LDFGKVQVSRQGKELIPLLSVAVVVHTIEPTSGAIVEKIANDSLTYQQTELRYLKMKQAKFNYPKEFLSLTKYTDHAGQIVIVIRELQKDEYDYQGEKMYLIRAKDGWTGEAFESELEFI
jgi:hypothetical protein